MNKITALIFITLGLMLSACAIPTLPNGQKQAWSHYQLPAHPVDGYMSPSLISSKMPVTPLVEAMRRNEKICEETGCPEWKAFIADIREDIDGKSTKQKAWRIHLAFEEGHVRFTSSLIQYGDKNYIASPAEFIKAGRRGDSMAVTLAEFMTFKELGWPADDLRYTMVMYDKYYIPVVMIKSPDLYDGKEMMLYYAKSYNESAPFYRDAALIYSTNGDKVWMQEWVRNDEYNIPVSSPLIASINPKAHDNYGAFY